MTGILSTCATKLRSIWCWLRTDYRWLWVVAPLGVIYFLLRRSASKLQVVGSEQVGADVTHEDILRTLASKDVAARELREQETAAAQIRHSAAVSVQVTTQVAHVAAYQEDSTELTSTMLRVGKEVRQ